MTPLHPQVPFLPQDLHASHALLFLHHLLPFLSLTSHLYRAARYKTGLLRKLTPKGVVFSYLSFLLTSVLTLCGRTRRPPCIRCTLVLDQLWPFSSVASHLHCCFVWQDKETFTATVLDGPFVAFLVSCISLPFLFCVAGQGDLHRHSAGCEPGWPYLQMPEPTGLHSHLTAQQGEGHLAQP